MITSSQLTTSTTGRQTGLGSLRRPARERGDARGRGRRLRIQGSITDVLNKTGGTEYTGQVDPDDHDPHRRQGNGDTAVLSGTVQDSDLGIPVQCVSTPDPAVGGSCSVNTTVDALAPNFAREGKRTIIATKSITVKDAGPNGTIGSGCPLSCGNGDETLYLRQGVFAP